MNSKLHLDRIFAIGGGLLLYLTVGFVVAQRFSETPLIAQAICAVPSILLTTWIARSGKRFQVGPRISKPSAFPMLIPVFLFLIFSWIANPVEPMILSTLTLHNCIQILRVFIFCLLVGIGEELMFRGYMFALCSRWNPAIALIVTSLLFGLLHIDQSWFKQSLAVVVGLGYGLARIVGAPLWVLAVLHAFTNLPVGLPHSEAPYEVNCFALLASIYTMIVTIAFVATPRYWREQIGVGKPDPVSS